MNKLKNVWLCALAAVFMVSQAYGQLTTATVTGTVTDASGAAIPGTSLTLENTTRGAIRTAVSDQSGRFFFDFVQVGSYKLTVAQTGFETGTRSGIDLVSGQVLDFPIQLALQQQSTRVEVIANATPLQTTEAQQVSTLNEAQVHDLPVSRFDWSNLITLTAGATRPPQTTANITTSAGSGVVINGLPSAGYNFTVDGTNAGSNIMFPAYNPYQAFSLINAVNNDSIQEVSVARGTPPAIVGNAMSANINIITKSGTNEFHGTVHELNEVSAYDARNQFLTYKPNTVFNDYGGSMGGPVLKNKLFFFGSYEQASLATARPVTGAVPTPYLISIAPSVYAPLFAYFPKVAQPANNPTATNAQFFGAGSNTQRDHNGVFRGDYYINSNNILAVRYISSHPFAITPALLPANPRTYIGWAENPSVAYTHTSARWTEDTRVAFNNMNENRVDGLLSDPNFGAYTFGWGSGGAKQLRYWGSYTTGQEAVSFAHGRQSIQFGGIVERQIASTIQYAPTQTVYPNLTAFLNNAPSTVNLEALGDPNSLNLPDGSPAFKYTRFQYGVYIQDDVKVTKNLTLNLGARYDYFTVPTEVKNRLSNRSFDPNRPGLGPGFGPIINKAYDPDYGGYQPRIGLAYNLFGRGKTVLRAGFAKMTMSPTLYSGAANGMPFNYALNAAQTKASGLKYPFNSLNYFSELATLQATGVISSALTIPGALALHFPDPYSLQWMFGIQQALPWRMRLEVNYNGNRGLNESTTEMVNLADRITGVSPSPTQGKQSLGAPYGRSKYAGLQVTLRKALSNGLTFSSAFTYAKATAVGPDDVISLSGPAPQNIYNRSADWGPAVIDIKLRSVTAALWDVPLAKWTHTKGFLSNLLLDGWALSGILVAQTGLPANVTNNSSTNNVDRPNACGCGVPTYLDGYQTGVHQFLNPKAFVAVPISSLSGEQIADGNLSFDAVRTPGLINVDAALSKTFALTERFRLRIRAETFNTLNHTNLVTLVTNINSSTFGQLTQATSRSMQLGARLTF